MTKKPPQSSESPEQAPESGPGTDRMAAELSKTLAEAHIQKAVAKAWKMVEEHEAKMTSAPPDEASSFGVNGEVGGKSDSGPGVGVRVGVEVDVEDAPDTSAMNDGQEVKLATTTLTGAVDQMVPSLLLAISLTDRGVKWMRSVAALMGVSIVLQGVILTRGWNAATANREAADSNKATAGAISSSNAELVKIKTELITIASDLKDIRKAEARRSIAESTAPKLVAGDRPGEVSIVAPTVSPKEIEEQQKKAEEAIDKGESPPPAPKKPTAKIPVQLRPGKIEQAPQPGDPLAP